MYNPPELNLVYTVRHFQPFAEVGKRRRFYHTWRNEQYNGITSEMIRAATLSVMENSSICKQVLEMKKEMRSKNANVFGANVIDEYMSKHC